MRRRLSRWWAFVQEEKLVLGAALLAAAFLAAGRVKVQRLPSVVDFELLLVLLALILAVELIRESNLLSNVVGVTIPRFRGARTFTGASIIVAGTLAALVTNDVALFVVIPFTILAGRVSGMNLRNAVMLQIVATNLLGCLTPLGNPQNLFLYHQSRWTAGTFIAAMAPLVLWSLIGLMIAVPLMEPHVRLETPSVEPLPLIRSKMMAGLAVFTLVLLEILHVLPAWPAAALAAGSSLLLIRDRIGEVDLFILPLFFFAFIIVEGLRSFEVYRLFEYFPREPDGLSLYLSALLSSQVISNVPAAVLLAPIAGERWKLLLYGVNAGGCGTMIASMANLIGWRIYEREWGRDRGFLPRFAVVQVAFLTWSGVGGWWLH